MLYNPPSGATGANDSYVGKNVAGGTQGSKVPRAAVENTQREIVNAIAASGQTPTNADLLQLWKAIQAGGQSGAKTVVTVLKIAGGKPYVYASAGTSPLAVPAGTTFRVGECRGGGGGGGGATSTSTAGSGGGQGALVSEMYATATVDTVLAITVGDKGGGGGSKGGTGGTTSVVVQSGSVTDANGTVYGAGATLCAATGGVGGTAGTGTTPASSGGSGGVASGPAGLTRAGDPGGTPVNVSGGGSPSFIGGGGGGGYAGPQAGPGYTVGDAGAGGSGASSGTLGGDGFPGRVKIFM